MMGYFLCDDCREPAFYARSEAELERHEQETGHTFVDDSPEWTLS